MNVGVGEPDQVPGATVKVLPSLNVPEIAGGEVSTGALPVDLTTSVGREVAVPDPEVFVAVTPTVSRWPTSAPMTV